MDQRLPDLGLPPLDSKGETEFLLGISEDITERKRAEEQGRENEKRYRELYDFLPIPVYESVTRPFKCISQHTVNFFVFEINHSD
jgi:PAS domain-containing protein